MVTYRIYYEVEQEVSALLEMVLPLEYRNYEDLMNAILDLYNTIPIWGTVTIFVKHIPTNTTTGILRISPDGIKQTNYAKHGNLN